MRGERVEETVLTEAGLTGDRLVRPQSLSGRRISARQYPGLLGLDGTTAADGTPLVNGHRWSSEEAQALVRDASSADIRLIEDRSRIRFDVLPVSLVTDGALEELGVDLRRLRPNIVIAGHRRARRARLARRVAAAWATRSSGCARCEGVA